MAKIKKDGIKNMHCSTCKTWMTEFYVSRHLHSKSHFTKKVLHTEHLRKDLWLAKRSRKKSPSAFKVYDFRQKKATPKMQSKDEQYKVAGDDIQNYSKVQAFIQMYIKPVTNLKSSTMIHEIIRIAVRTSQSPFLILMKFLAETNFVKLPVEFFNKEHSRFKFVPLKKSECYPSFHRG